MIAGLDESIEIKRDDRKLFGSQLAIIDNSIMNARTKAGAKKILRSRNVLATRDAKLNSGID